MVRSTAEVSDDHLARADRGDVKGDILANFAPDDVLPTSYGRFEGHEGLRAAAALLAQQVPNAKYVHSQRAVYREIAFLEWTATSHGVSVSDGADTFPIRHDRIQAMTTHYTMETEKSA